MLGLGRRIEGLFRSDDGNISILFGLLAVPLLIAGGMAVDIARSAQAKTIIQEAADAALLRAARLKSENPGLTDAALTARAREIFDAATRGLAGVTIAGFKLVHDGGSDTYSLRVDGGIATTLIGVAGFQSLDVGAVSEVSLGPPPYIEVAMALDNTGSMNTNNKIGALRDAASDLVETLFASGTEVKVGLVPFAQYVNVGASNAGATWLQAPPAGWTGCVGSRAFPSNTEDADYATKAVPAINGVVCPAPIQPLTDDKAALLTSIAGMKADGWTYIAEGVAWGARVLSPGAPFTGGLAASEVQKRGGIKALIVLTDGENTKAPTYPLHDSADRALADDLTRRACAEAKKNGVVIYTIAFDVDDPGVRGLLEDCGATPANYFEPSNAKELSAVFARIAASLRNLSLSK